MSDKENEEKENEQFSSSILYVATAVYLAICTMVAGALTAQKPTFGDAFLLFFKDYGAILAGIPVLIAVLVAKQQLDAMRRQHRSNVKIGTIDRLNAVKISKAKMQTLSQWKLSDSKILLMKDRNIPVFTAFDSQNNEYLRKYLSPTLYSIVMMTDKHFCSIYPMVKENDSLPLDTVRIVFEIGQNLAKEVLGQLDAEENELRSLAD